MTNLESSFMDPSQSKTLIPERSDTVASSAWAIKTLIHKLGGGGMLVLGFLLSPLSWWNDLLFNLPIAYGFGYVCNLVIPGVLGPAAIAGYWVSNVLGIVLMQAGAVKIFQKQPQQNNLKKELLSGLISSTAYTLLIVLLIQLKILDGLHLPFDISAGS
jgi:hypothetical protein